MAETSEALKRRRMRKSLGFDPETGKVERFGVTNPRVIKFFKDIFGSKKKKKKKSQ